MQVNSDFTMDRIRSAKQAKTNFADFCISQNTSSQVSFTGLPKVSEAIEKFGEDFGVAAKNHFKEIIEKANKLENSGLTIKDNSITFRDQTYLEKALDILFYPVKQMPFDLTNATIGGLKKIPGIKKSSWINNLYDSELLTKKRDISKNKSNVAAIQHYFELLTEGNNCKRFCEGHKRLAPLMPNYNSETERSLNRLVTGIIPAFFLANDAYNLSIYMNNNKSLAKEEKKRRFNQEVIRIGITSAATYAVMSMFAKQCNKSIPLTASITAGIVLVSEVMGRLIAGNPVLPVGVQRAKEYAEKRKEIKQNNISEPAQQQATENKPVKKEILTLNNILKTIAGLIVFGFATEKVSNIPKIKGYLQDFSKKYKKLYMKDFIISRDEFSKITKKLKDNGFNEIANRYERSIEGEKGKNVKLGSTKDKTKYILIHQILTFPVRFTWSVLTLPYNSLVKPLIKMVKKEPKLEKKLDKIEMLQNSIRFLEKIKNDASSEFTRKINEKLISSFDNLTKSSYQNSDLNVIVKTAQSAVTTGFLIADNYNMVMIDSEGENKNLAKQKAKERAIQRGARLTYEAFIIKMILDMFAGACNASLLAALGVSGALRVVTEMVERKAVGLPLGESTQEEIKENEIEHLNATGLKGVYFRAMAKLTGKSSIGEKQKNNKNS